MNIVHWAVKPITPAAARAALETACRYARNKTRADAHWWYPRANPTYLVRGDGWHTNINTRILAPYLNGVTMHAGINRADLIVGTRTTPAARTYWPAITAPYFSGVIPEAERVYTCNWIAANVIWIDGASSDIVYNMYWRESLVVLTREDFIDCLYSMGYRHRPLEDTLYHRGNQPRGRYSNGADDIDNTGCTGRVYNTDNIDNK